MRRRPIPLVCAFLFVLTGFALSNQAGIQNDEALFGSALYQQAGLADRIELRGHGIPLMLMSYLGALKTWIYAPIFRFWRPSAMSLRVPVILAGGFTVWLFWSLTRRIAGERAAAIGCCLLATDSLFVLTTTLDWGPVVLQHVLLVGGCLSIVRFHQEKRQGFLAAGFLLFGLAFWDKALFVWMGSGLALAAILVFPRELRNYLNPRHLAIALLSFCLGSAPLLAYNIRYPLGTFRNNAAYDLSDIRGRLFLLKVTLQGRSVFGYIPRDDPAGQPRQPRNPVESSSIWLSAKTGGESASFFYPALIGSLLLLPWLWFTASRRTLAFTALAMTIAWVQTLITRNAGGSVHHLILIWPFPTLLVAVTLAAASRRLGKAGKPFVAAVIALVAGSNLLVTNEYLARLVRNGTSVTWTDAIYPLSDCLRRVKARAIYIDDWGMFDNLITLSRGALPLLVGNDPLSNERFSEENRRTVLARLSESDSIFVGHADGNELYSGVNARLRSIAGEAGYAQEIIATIPDRNGREIFEVVRFVRR